MNWRHYALAFLGMVIGTAIAGIGLNLFLVPNRLAAGGVSGMGVIFYHLSGIPVGLTIIAFNVPLFLVAVRMLGWRFALQSLVGAALFSLMAELFAFAPHVTGDLLLSSVYGGALLGVGMGIVFRSGGTTGGTALAARLVSRGFGVSVGEGLVASDILVIAAAGAIFGAELALYATIALLVSGWLVDVIQEGPRFSKTAVIITNHGDAINAGILTLMDRGVTRLTVTGGYTGEEREALLCVFHRNEITQLKSVVAEVDPDAFVIVGNASEVLGEGFKRE